MKATRPIATTVAPIRSSVTTIRSSVSTIQRDAIPARPAPATVVRSSATTRDGTRSRPAIERSVRAYSPPIGTRPARASIATSAPVTAEDRQGEDRPATFDSQRRVLRQSRAEAPETADLGNSRFRNARQAEGDNQRFRESMADSRDRDRDHGHDHGHGDRPHRHGPGCGHYFHGGGWKNHSPYHRHGPGCGHYHYHSGWHDFPSTHIHSSRCGHFHDGSSWIVIGGHGHVHGTGCGHHFYRNRWRAYPRHFYTRSRFDSFFFFVDLGSYESRNLPRRVYRETLVGDQPIDVFESSDPVSAAYAAFSDGNYYASLVEFNQAIGQDPENGILYLARAQARVAIGDYRLAYEDLIEGMRRIPEWADVAFNVSEIYSDPEDLGEHLAALEAWIERNPGDARGRFVLGYLYYFLQDYESAKGELVRVLSTNESHEQAKALLQRALQDEADQDAATREPAEPAEPADEAPVTRE